MLTKVMRYQIVKPIDVDWNTFGEILRELQRETRIALNKTIQLAWEYHGFSAEYKEIHGRFPKNREVLGKEYLHGYAYTKLRPECWKIITSNLSQTVKRAADKWNNDLPYIIRGEKSIPSFRRDVPIDVDNEAIKILKENDHYILDISLISTEYRKQLGRKNGKFKVLIMTGEKSKRIILDRIMDGTYKLGASQILYKKNKWYINLTYKFVNQLPPLDPEAIMGVDLGVTNAVYMAFNNSLNRYKIVGGEIEQFRKQIERRRRELLIQSKYAGEGRSGHGTKTKIAPIEVLERKAANFKNTVNHKYARYIVNMALKHRCGTIQLEDLSGIREDNTFLANWPYYDLQQKIEYKAKEVGIRVVKINPEYTSQRCSHCGHIAKENRPDQATFECTKCGLKTNADFNAAKNIATPGIEDLIRQALS